MYLATATGFVIATDQPLLLDPTAMAPLVLGMLDAGGTASFAFPVPASLTDAVVTPLFFQAAALDSASVVRLSNRVDRLIRAPRP